MQVIDEMEVKGRGFSRRSGKNGERSELFKREDGIKYCKVCGKKWKENELVKTGTGMCASCGDLDFISGDFASVIGGYIKLLNDGLLKKYYDNKMGSSGARMNTRRMIVWMLVKDGFFVWGDRKIENVIYKIIRENTVVKG